MEFNYDILLIIIFLLEALRGSIAGVRKSIKRDVSLIISFIGALLICRIWESFFSKVSEIFMFLGDWLELLFSCPASSISRWFVLLLVYGLLRIITYLVISLFVRDYTEKNASELVSKKSAWGGVVASIIPSLVIGWFLFVTFMLLGTTLKPFSSFIYGAYPIILGGLGI